MPNRPAPGAPKPDGTLPASVFDYMLTFGGSSAALFLGLTFVFVFAWARGGVQISLAILWAMACFTAGGIVGFLFGIPKVLQRDEVAPPAETNAGARTGTGDGGTSGNGDRGRGAAPRRPSDYSQMVNTNLEQISDWLTKIIVGLGLIELRRLPEFLSRASAFMAGSFGGDASARGFGAAIILYFSIIGFLAAYIVTRIYLAGAFKRADTGVGSIEVDGRSQSLEEVVEQHSKLFIDLIGHSKMKDGETAGDEESGLSGTGSGSDVRSILWVDDHPEYNSTLIAGLKRRGITVETCTSSDDALARYKIGSFDRVISDMGRTEGGSYNETAGLEFVARLREVDRDVPVIIYCAPHLANKHREAAEKAGANAITASQTTLLSFVE